MLPPLVAVACVMALTSVVVNTGSNSGFTIGLQVVKAIEPINTKRKNKKLQIDFIIVNFGLFLIIILFRKIHKV
jgi:hypothetical protein